MWGAEGFFGGGASAAGMCPCSCCFPRVKWPFPCCSFLGVSVVSWLCPSRCSRTEWGVPHSGRTPRPASSITPAPGHVTLPAAGVSSPLALDTTSVMPGRAGAAPGRGRGWHPHPGRAAAVLHCSPEGLGSTLRPDKKLFVCPGDAKAALEGAGRCRAGRFARGLIRLAVARATLLPWQCSNLS